MSRVAADLGVTQSAVSHAVERLRSIFEDRLFVRRGSGVEPTPRALLLGPSLGAAIADVRIAMAAGRAFDPGLSSRAFALAAPDTVVAALAPKVLATFAGSAPGCSVAFQVLPPHQATAAVADGRVDLAVGSAFDATAGTIGRPLSSDNFGVVARSGHPSLRDGVLDLDTYCRLDHLLVSSERNARGIVDDVLGGMGRERRLLGVMPHLMATFAAVSRSDAVITAPMSACRYAESLFAVAIHRPPFDLPALDLMLRWHRDGAADPGLKWFAEVVVSALDTGAP